MKPAQAAPKTRVHVFISSPPKLFRAAALAPTSQIQATRANSAALTSIYMYIQAYFRAFVKYISGKKGRPEKIRGRLRRPLTFRPLENTTEGALGAVFRIPRSPTKQFDNSISRSKTP
jgi:hypothetical protein